MLMIFIMMTNSKIYSQSPQLIYSTLIGGSGWDYGHAITVDEEGYAYISGQANSTNYPTTAGALDRTANGGSDILITKLNKEGNALVYSSYIGGSGRDDTRKVFVEKSGCVYLTGATASSNFPTTTNALSGNSGNYFLKLDSTGSYLQYSSRWGGGEKLLLDSVGNLIILGSTTSPDLPTTENAFCRTHSGDQDIYVAKVNLANNAIIFSTFIGGSGKESSLRMTIDSEDNIIITGQTASENYPLKGKLFSDYNGSKPNLFLTKLKSDGSDILFSTIIGGAENDYPMDIAVDRNNNIFVIGMTKSNDFPVSPSAFDISHNNGDDAFLFKVSSDGDSILYSTYIGGSDKDWGRGIVIDKSGRAYITGCTKSTNFPVSENAYDKTFNGAGTESWAWGDPFLLVMNAEGTQVEYSTYFGGSGDEEAYGIAMDNKGDIYICGITSSNNFPTTEGAYDRTKNGSTNIYAAKFLFTHEKTEIDYLGQTPPGNTPVVFAPGIISVNGIVEHSAPTFSPDGNEVFWQANKLDSQQNWIITCMTMRRVGNTWSAPEATSFGYAPFFSPDGKRLYFESNGEGTDPKYIEKNGDNWSEPVTVDIISRFPEIKFAYNLSIASNGTLYFLGYAAGLWNNLGLYHAELVNGEYAKPELLPSGINAPGNTRNWTPYIAPDESYLIFSSSRGTSIYDQGDLYVSFRQPDGTWKNPVSLGTKINSNKNERFPAVSPDGKYLFFTRSDDDYDEGILWVSAAIIDSLKAVVTDVKEDGIGINKSFKLNQNYPNPFNPSTTIGYQISESSNVKIKIYDTLGQEVKTLVDSFLSAGRHSISWNATDNSNNPVSSGIYFYRIETQNSIMGRKMVLVQ